ncbi:hypothetical protein Droror1_Dr00014753 [Drosera rotundifolia]
MAVVSAAFESSLSLSFYVQFAYYLDQQNVDIIRALHKKLPAPVAHGLGTYRWLKDVGTDMFKTSHNSCDGGVEASIYDANHLLRHFEINQRVILRSSITEYRMTDEGTMSLSNLLQRHWCEKKA